MSETYTQEARVITDLITGGETNMRFRMEKSFHNLPLEAFGLLEDVHPSGEYVQYSSSFYFHVFYYGIEFTFYCAERFEGGDSQ